MSKRKPRSRKGRPLKSGARYACGKLRPQPIIEDNAILKAKRADGDSSAGEHPLDYALQHGLITMRQYRNGLTFEATYRQANTGGPRLASGGPTEVEQSVLGEAPYLGKSWVHELGPERMVQVWDSAFNRVAGPDRNEAAMTRWREMNSRLTQAQRDELFNVCITVSWPLWMPTLKHYMAHRPEGETQQEWEARIPGLVGQKRADARIALLSGLDALSPKPAPKVQPIPQPRYTGPVTVEKTAYVNEDGELLFTAERRVRR